MKKTNCFQWLIKNLPIPFSFNLFYNKKKGSIIIIGCEGSEYEGQIEMFDKFFNFTLNKCLKLSKLNSFFFFLIISKLFLLEGIIL